MSRSDSTHTGQYSRSARKGTSLSGSDERCDFDACLDEEIQTSIAVAERRSLSIGEGDLPLYDVLRYHLGFLNAEFQSDRSDAGKRVRPRLALLVTEAAGGAPYQGIHAAAAIELLHNFTLIHDDIQDESPLRRHRPTVWSQWGIAQAINAGDAMFAVAQLALNRSVTSGVTAETTLRLSEAMLQTTLRIVEGQTLDLGFERRDDVSAEEYLEMIGGKTSAITRLACWSGALIAGLGDDAAEAIGDFGFALGVGFQVQDDWLGVWGDPSLTGKAAADDIRRRKKALPALLLRERAEPADRERLRMLYAQPEIAPDQVQEVLDLLTRYEIAPDVRAAVRGWHDRAAVALEAALPASPARDDLARLVESLGARTG